jgi:hypothetical protein
MSTSTLVHTSVRPSPGALMRDIAAHTAAQRRVQEGVVRNDPAYGISVCLCSCRRCIPTKDDCGSCIYGDCVRAFLSHTEAAAHFASFGIVYNTRTHRFEN